MATAPVTKNINLTIKGEILKNSAIPAHTPNKTLSVEDLINFFNQYSPLFWFINDFILKPLRSEYKRLSLFVDSALKLKVRSILSSHPK